MGSPIVLTAFEDRLFADLPDAEVAEMLRSRGLPGRRTETWKWSDLRGALRAERKPSEAYKTDVPEPPLSLPDATVLTISNGRAAPPAGVEPKPIVKGQDKIGVTYVVDDGLIVSLYEQGREAQESVASGEEVATIAALGPLMTVAVLPGFRHQVVLRRLADGDGAHTDNIFVTVGEGASLVLAETHEISGSPFINSRTEIEVDAAGQCERYIVQPRAPEAVLVHTSIIRLDERNDNDRARLKQTTLAHGAQLSRHETRLAHLGESHAEINALYQLTDRLHADVTSHITFSGEEAQTDQLVKGIGDGQSRGVFQGKFLVERGAQRTDAQMSHHALLLSKGAQVNAKPELEIYADDVECAHGNTVGALDTEAMFYMLQRGLSAAEATALLIEAFSSEVLERIDREEIREQLHDVMRRAA